MKAILGLLAGVPQSRLKRDDDFGDRLNHRYTVSIFLVFSIIVTTSQYVGERINCWVPAHFSDPWTDYTNSYCWVKNTYYLPMTDYIPKEHEEDARDVGTLSYYQWVPLILLLQALFYYMPCMVWRSFNDRSGIDVSSIVETALTFHQAETVNDREKNLDKLTRQMHRFMTNREKKTFKWDLSLSTLFAALCCPKCGRRHGNYLNTLYIITKIFYVLNAVGQLFLLDFFFGTDFHLYGFDAIYQWMQGGDISETQRFPRVTMCDFKVRYLPGDVQRYTVQCVLPINLFHEKIYLIIWFWMVWVAAFNVYSLFSWVARSAFRIDRHRFLKKHILENDRIALKKDQELRALMISFCETYLGTDGIFVLRLVQENTDDLAVLEITQALWEQYKKDHGKEPVELQPTAPPMNDHH